MDYRNRDSCEDFTSSVAIYTFTAPICGQQLITKQSKLRDSQHKYWTKL